MPHDDDKTKLPSPPPGLKAPGRRLWRDVLRQRELSLGELAVLEAACRAQDRQREAEEVLAAEGLTVPGRWGKQAHPLTGVAKDGRAQLLAALKQLDVALEDDGRIARPGPRPSTHRKANLAAIEERKRRWGTAAT